MNEHVDLTALQSEGRNPRTLDIDVVDTIELCRLINDEDKAVPLAVEQCLPAIASTIDALTGRVRDGGRVIYTGAGTSGRLGVLDASELPPTFSADPAQFVAIIAGGDIALRHAVEGAEDDREQAAKDLRKLRLGNGDCLIGIAASGRTPYVLSCLSYAKALGCLTVGISCSSPSAMLTSGHVDHMIEAVSGPEVISGSTRLKAGTATKLVLNMLSTGVHIRLGKTYSNLMVDVRATNQKLKERARRIIRQCCQSSLPISDDELDLLLARCNGSVKLAIASLRLGVSAAEAQHLLQRSGGILASIVSDHGNIAAAHGDVLASARYVLCVDGGGSKCAVFILGSNGEAGSATAPSCNVTTTDASVAIALILKAVKQAIDQCVSLRGLKVEAVSFARVRIGLAGFDRPKTAAAVDAGLRSRLKVDTGNVSITNDLGLVAAAVGRPDDMNVCVLVAGTGSIAMSFERTQQGYRQTGRAGGWGPLLGDDGSGFDIGRKAVRLLLEAQDTEHTATSSGTAAVTKTDSLNAAVLQHLGLSHRSARVNDTLAVLLLQSNSGDPKQKIAGIARVVLEQQNRNHNAASIVAQAGSSLTGLLQRVVASSRLDPGTTVMVLTGGMMQNPFFLSGLQAQICKGGLKFARTEVVLQAGLFAAQRLLESLDNEIER